MTPLVLFVAVVYVLVSALKGAVNLANLRYAQAGGIPDEFKGMVDEEKFAKAQAYLGAQTWYGLAHRAVSTIAGVTFLLFGGFGWVDRIALGFQQGPVATALLYFLILMVLDQLIELPFSWYHTFVLEERFGFNRSSVKTFLGDMLKGWGLGIVLGGLLGGALVWFFLYGGQYAWLWAWGFFTLFQITLMFLAPVVLMPLFNKFEPLPEGELKAAIEAFASSVNFKLQGIFTMDGSKRSSKANAFFTGFGKFRRIVLFDTLVKQHTVPELVAVLAHEVGHFKRKHILKQIALSLVSSFVLFWFFSVLLSSDTLAMDFGFALPSVQAAITMAFWFYSPFSFLTGLLSSGLSRKFEFEADAYARETTKDAPSLAAALKRLSVESLSNLNPHPWKVILDYSHPPVIQRIRALLAQ